MRLEKSGELMMIRGIQDELDSQTEWKMRRRKLNTFLVAIAVVTGMIFLAPHMPGYGMISNAVRSVVAAIW